MYQFVTAAMRSKFSNIKVEEGTGRKKPRNGSIRCTGLLLLALNLEWLHEPRNTGNLWKLEKAMELILYSSHQKECQHLYFRQ